MRFLLAASLAAGLLVPALAAADTSAVDTQQMKTDDCARARKQHKTCVLDMGGETLEGNGVKGDGERVDILDFGTSQSLIRIRREFIAEILKSAEDL